MVGETFPRDGCILRVKTDAGDVSVECCSDSTTFRQDGDITWEVNRVISPCFTGMFASSAPPVYGLSPGQVVAVILCLP